MRAFRPILAFALALALPPALAPKSDAGWPNSGRVYGGGGGASVVAVSINFPSGSVGGVNCASLAACIADIRSSTATYINGSGGLSTAAVNTPRVDCTNATCGLLNEGSSTNINPYSVITSANWGNFKSGSGATPGITNNAAASPDGAGAAAAVTINRSASADYSEILTSGVNYASTGVYTHSIWLQASSSPYIGAQITVGAYLAVTFGSAVTLPSALTRLSVNFTAPYTGSGQANIGYLDGTGATTTGAVGFNAWGDQVEPLTFASSYIPTSGSAVTRAADSMSATGALATAMAAGQSYVDMIDEATGATSRTLYAAGAFNWPPYKWITQICAYSPSVGRGYLTAHSTYGTSC
jgi:hypothetical protein